MKTIIWEYNKAFVFGHIKIAMMHIKDKPTLVVQDDFGHYGKKCNGMIEYTRIDDEYCFPVYSKTVEIDEPFFQSAYNAIATSLAPIFSSQEKIGLDGDSLTIYIQCDEGHKCKFYLWAPAYEEDDCYKTNSIFHSFLQILEKAGLLEWYEGK